ncbi:MAG: hypothetical protein KF774_18860 [Planctomyces sp.]|nr:hypothetical protein [Planctomyces sp.]
MHRLWRCPACGYERRVGQQATSVECACHDPPRMMKLIEGQRVVRPEPRPVARFIDEADLPPDDSPPRPAPPVPPLPVQPVEPVQAVEAAPPEPAESRAPTAVSPPPQITSPASEPLEPGQGAETRGKRRRNRRGKKVLDETGSAAPSTAADATSEAAIEPVVEPPSKPFTDSFGVGIDEV